MLDLEYTEDVRAEVDMNVVMTGDGRFVEVQGTAEGIAFTRAELDALLGLAERGIAEIIAAQQRDGRRAAHAARMTALPLPFVLATQQRRQGPRDRRDLRRAHRRAARRVRDRVDGTTIAFLLDAPDRIAAAVAALPALDARRPTSRRPAPRSRRTRASRRARSRDALGLLADRRRHRSRGRRARRRARRVLGALRRARRDVRRQRRASCCASSKACTRRCAPRASRRSRSRAGPTGARSRCAARSRA